MMIKTTLSGKLERPPYGGMLTPSVAYRMPYQGENDFEQMSSYENAGTTPVLVSLTQYYEVLADIVSNAGAILAGNFRTLIALRIPFLRPLPDELLDRGVLMLNDSSGEESHWVKSASAELLVIRDRMLRDHNEAGDNSIACTFWTRKAPDSAAIERFTASTAAFRAMSHCVLNG